MRTLTVAKSWYDDGSWTRINRQDVAKSPIEPARLARVRQ